MHNELEWMWKEVVTACLKYCCNICLKGQRKANENVRLAGAMEKIHTRYYHLNQSSSVDLYNIIHHCQQNKCLTHIPVYLSTSKS